MEIKKTEKSVGKPALRDGKIVLTSKKQQKLKAAMLREIENRSRRKTYTFTEDDLKEAFNAYNRPVVNKRAVARILNIPFSCLGNYWNDLVRRFNKYRATGSFDFEKHDSRVGQGLAQLTPQVYSVLKYGTMAGYSEQILAEMCGVSHSTLRKWRRRYPEVVKIIDQGRALADTKIMRAAYKRATGMTVPDLYITQYQGEIVQKPIRKYLPPNTKLLDKWLSARVPWWSTNNEGDDSAKGLILAGIQKALAAPDVEESDDDDNDNDTDEKDNDEKD